MFVSTLDVKRNGGKCLPQVLKSSPLHIGVLNITYLSLGRTRKVRSLPRSPMVLLLALLLGEDERSVGSSA